MIIESARLICDWLNDGTNGVNALLPSTPLDAGDAPPINLASIVDCTRDTYAASGRLPAALPGLAIMVLPVENLAPHITVADAEGDVRLAIRLGMTSAQTEAGFAASSYYLRTIVRSLRRFNAADPTLRTRNGIYLEGCHEMSLVQLWDKQEDAVITGAVLLTFHTRDIVAV
jgi:hypothetical protein